MNFYTQKWLSAYFGLQQDVDAQLFKGRFELSTEGQHWPTLAFEYGTKNTKTKDNQSETGENGRPNVSEETENRIRIMLSEDLTLSLRNVAIEIGICHPAT